MGDMTREPSMEEILSSIRRVIARDESARDDSVRDGNIRADSGSPELSDGDDDDTLDLTEQSPLITPTADGAAATNMSSNADQASDDLVSDGSVQASRQSLDALSAIIGAGPATPDDSASALHGDVTLNAMVESMLRPMLRQWLDSNLPPLVERLVSREIAKITGNRF